MDKHNLNGGEAGIDLGTPQGVAAVRGLVEAAKASGLISFHKERAKQSSGRKAATAEDLRVAEGLKLPEPFSKLTLMRYWRCQNTVAKSLLSHWKRRGWLESAGYGAGYRRAVGFGK